MNPRKQSYRVKLPSGMYVAAHVRNTGGKLRLHQCISFTADRQFAQCYTLHMARTIAQANHGLICA